MQMQIGTIRNKSSISEDMTSWVIPPEELKREVKEGCVIEEVSKSFSIMIEEDWESWTKLINACVNLSQTPLTLYEINRDVKMVQGRDIPYRWLKFNSLEEMINNISGLQVTKLNGILTVVKATVRDQAKKFLMSVPRKMQHKKQNFKKLGTFSRATIKFYFILCALIVGFFNFENILLFMFDAPDTFKHVASNNQTSIDRHSKCSALKAPVIPSIGSIFHAHIIKKATDPGIFIIQPFNNVHEFDTLMKELSRFCESFSGSPVISNSLNIGNMYAAKYDESGRWSRASIFKIIDKSVCVVYFCDYDEYRVVSLEQLRPLENNFYDLPCQAIKAKLHGKTAKLMSSWIIKDSLMFNELIKVKNFVSIIKFYEEENSPGERILDLELIDTSNVEDISSYSILFNKNRVNERE